MLSNAAGLGVQLESEYSTLSVDDWIEWYPPILVGIVHHQVHEDGHQEREDFVTPTEVDISWS